MSYYRHHLFLCLNRRPEDAGRPSCGHCGAADARGYVKERVKALGLAGAGGVRVSAAGCLDRCELGPCLVIYPDAVWYTYAGQADLDEIIQSHLIDGHPVERLRLPDA